MIKLNNFNVFIVNILFLLMAFGVFLNLSRLFVSAVGGDIHIFGLFVNGLYLFLFLAAAVSVAILFFRFGVPPFVLLLIFFLFYGVSVGVLSGNDLLNIAKNFYLFAFSVVFISLGFFLYRTLNKINFRLSVFICFYANIVATFLFYALNIYMFIYPGFGTHAMGYVVLYFAVFGYRLLLFLAFVVLLAQGKRSILVSILVCLALVFLHKKIGLRRLFFLGAVFSFSSMVVFFGCLEWFDLYWIPGLSRFKFVNPFSIFFDPFVGSSGRLDEIVSALKKFAETPLNWIFGSGFGFSYRWDISYSDNFTEVKSYVHNVPLMFFLFFGPLGLVVIYGYLVIILSQVLRIKRLYFDDEKIKLIMFITFSGLFFLISSLFSLNALSDPLGWIFIGLVMAIINANRKRHIDKFGSYSRGGICAV